MESRSQGRRGKASGYFAGKLDDASISDAITRAKGEGRILRLEDGQGLRLVVTPQSARWVFRFVSKATGKRRDMGLGPFPRVPLQTARELIETTRAQLLLGTDPLEQRRRAIEAERQARAEEHVATLRSTATLEVVARDYHAKINGQFRNDKHRAQWLASLENHVFDKLGDRPVDSIKPNELLDLLIPLRDSVPETARRVRQRLDAIFEHAMLRELTDRNPAKAILRAMREGKRAQAEKHFAALPFADVPGFIVKLRAFERVGVAAKAALEWTILTGARTGETLGATWGEIDLAKHEWTVPGARMKMGRPHRVPLSETALALLEAVWPLRASDRADAIVFPSPLDPRKPLSNMAMAMILRRLDVTDATVHGFRQCLSTWARENTRYRVDTIEAALAHRDENKVVRAYSHAAEYWEERRALAAEWAKFCTTPPSINKRPQNVYSMDDARRA